MKKELKRNDKLIESINQNNQNIFETLIEIGKRALISLGNKDFIFINSGLLILIYLDDRMDQLENTFNYLQHSLELRIESLSNELDCIEEIILRQVNSIEKNIINYKEYAVFKAKKLVLHKQNIGQLYTLLTGIGSVNKDGLYRVKSNEISNSIFIKKLFTDLV